MLVWQRFAETSANVSRYVSASSKLVSFDYHFNSKLCVYFHFFKFGINPLKIGLLSLCQEEEFAFLFFILMCHVHHHKQHW